MLHSTPTPAATTLVEIDDLRDMLSNESDFGPAHFAVLQKATNKQQATAFRQEVDELRRTVKDFGTDAFLRPPGGDGGRPRPRDHGPRLPRLRD